MRQTVLTWGANPNAEYSGKVTLIVQFQIYNEETLERFEQAAKEHFQRDGVALRERFSDFYHIVAGEVASEAGHAHILRIYANSDQLSTYMRLMAGIAIHLKYIFTKECLAENIVFNDTVNEEREITGMSVFGAESVINEILPFLNK